VNVITAKTARELAGIPAESERIYKKIHKAAKKGEPSIFISGRLNWELHKILRDQLGFEVSYDAKTKRTCVWWGN